MYGITFFYIAAFFSSAVVHGKYSVVCVYSVEMLPHVCKVFFSYYFGFVEETFFTYVFLTLFVFSDTDI